MKTMSSLSKRQLIRSALGVAALAASFGAMAQDGARPIPPHGGPAITLKCCRCIGETTTTPILSGQSPFTLNGSLAPAVASPHSLWATAPPAQWIGTSPGNAAPGTYTYQLRIVIPRCLIGSRIEIKGRYWADDGGTVSIAAFGGATASGSGTPTLTTNPSNQVQPSGWGFLQGNSGSFNFTASGPGTVTLTFTTTNGPVSPAGLLVKGDIVQRCATEPGGPGPQEASPVNDKKE